MDEEEAIMSIVYESIDLSVLKDTISKPFLNVIFNCLNKKKELRWNTLKVYEALCSLYYENENVQKILIGEKIKKNTNLDPDVNSKKDETIKKVYKTCVEVKMETDKILKPEDIKRRLGKCDKKQGKNTMSLQNIK